MLTLKAKKREVVGKKVNKLRQRDILPGVLYGPKIKDLSLELNLKEFEKVYKKAGESSLVSLEIDKDKFLVLIHEIRKNPLTEKPIHVDFYQPLLTKEIEATVPLVFEGLAPAVKDLGGTLVKEIQQIEVKALPQNLPHEIKVNVESLKTFEDEILIRDINLPEGVKIQRGLDEIVAVVTPPEKVEEEVQKPIEEKVEEVEKVEKVEKEEEKIESKSQIVNGKS